MGEEVININTHDYWNERFSSKDWINKDGKNQSKFFMQLLISNLPSEIFNDISNNCKYINDFGSALCQGCFELSQSFPYSQITGYDISEEAIKQASEIYKDNPNLTFTSTPLQIGIDKFDCLVCSNTLEHLIDYNLYLELFTKISQKYIILLVPYKSEIFDEHVVSFDENSFPDEINGFVKVFSLIINTEQSGFWNGEQFLLAYKKQE